MLCLNSKYQGGVSNMTILGGCGLKGLRTTVEKLAEIKGRVFFFIKGPILCMCIVYFRNIYKKAMAYTVCVQSLIDLIVIYYYS